MASTFKSHANDDGSVMIRGMASTNHSDRAGDVIAAEAWTKGGLDNFQNNPVILFNHDYDKPIGRATGVKVTENGLELEAKISKSAPASVCELVKDGVLGAFSVGFKVKDADYLKETDGLMIKDAELFEVSVVSVPCNQAATFSLAKSFDSVEEYNEFKKTFTNRVDLTGQSLTKDDSKESKVVSDAPKQVEKSTIKETNMSEETKTPEIDLEAFAKKVADETAAKIAMKQAEEKAAAQAEVEAKEAQALEAKKIQTSIKSGIQTGVEKLEADLTAEITKAKDEELAGVVGKYESQLKEHAAELEAMRNSKKNFAGRGRDVSEFGKEILEAKILGELTGKGWDTKYGRGLQEKTVDFGAAGASVGLDVSMTNAFETEVTANYKVAQLFREVTVNSGATVLPFAPEPGLATFSAGGIATDSNMLTDAGDNNYTVQERILNAKRVIAGTFIGADTDEQTIVNMLPMLTERLAVAHARAIDSAIVVGNSSIAGLGGGAGTDGGGSFLAADSSTVADKDASATDGSDVVSAADILSLRQEMGKYGTDPSELALILPYDQYYKLMDDAGFADIAEVGSDAAAGRGINPRVSGILGYVYGVPVVATEFLSNQLAATGAATTSAGILVNTNNFIIPRLRGVSIQSDVEVANQRTALVASQSLGFEQLAANASGAQTAVRIEYA